MTAQRHKNGGDYLLEDVHNYRINRKEFIIYIGGDPVHGGNEGVEPGVNYAMADRFEANLDILSSIDRDRPILVNMASCGGCWEEGLQMHSAILACDNPITVLATKHARSMTSLIPLAADKFVIRAPATFMYHRGTYGIETLDEEAETEDNQRRKNNELMMRMYTARLLEQGKHTDWTEARIKAMLRQTIRENINVHLSADEAVEWGFADEVFVSYDDLRTPTINLERRESMLSVLRKKITLKITVS
jgi:ATP-dependent protease ClpP protease subunit